MSNLNSSQAEAIERAKLEGFKIIRSKADRILLDLDSAEDIEYFKERWPRIAAALEMRGIEASKPITWKSKSGKGKHVLIKFTGTDLNTTFRSLPIVDRLLLEVALGSDRQRAFLSLMRHWDGNPEPGTLFRPNTPEKTVKKKSFKLVPTKANTILDDDVPF